MISNRVAKFPLGYSQSETPACSATHTGWTGQSIWIDPRSKLYVIVLTNRDHELTNRDNPKNVASLYNAAKRFRIRIAEAMLATCDVTIRRPAGSNLPVAGFARIQP